MASAELYAFCSLLVNLGPKMKFFTPYFSVIYRVIFEVVNLNSVPSDVSVGSY